MLVRLILIHICFPSGAKCSGKVRGKWWKKKLCHLFSIFFLYLLYFQLVIFKLRALFSNYVSLQTRQDTFKFNLSKNVHHKSSELNFSHLHPLSLIFIISMLFTKSQSLTQNLSLQQKFKIWLPDFGSSKIKRLHTKRICD